MKPKMNTARNRQTPNSMPQSFGRSTPNSMQRKNEPTKSASGFIGRKSSTAMKTFVVIDHICEADIVIAVFSTKARAKTFIKNHRDDSYSPDSRMRRYEGLDIEEFELDKQP